MKSRLTLAELSVLKKFASFLTACGNDELNVAVVSARNIPKARLTQRESEVLAQIAVGFKNGEIAPKLGVSKRTIEAHRSNIVRKLKRLSGKKSVNTASLANYALAHGLANNEWLTLKTRAVKKSS